MSFDLLLSALTSLESRTSGLRLCPRRQMNVQTRLLPDQIRLLFLHPVPTLFCDFDIEIPHQTSQYEAHFGISQTAKGQYHSRRAAEKAYFIARQLRGP